jgi:hypothetical protein
MLTDYSILGPADLSRAAFMRILRDAQSPALTEAGALYDALIAAGVRLAPFLAFFRQESRFGLAGIAAQYQTHNPGNVRTPEQASAATIVNTPRGQFATYSDWTTGTRDWAARMRGPKYGGRGLRTVRQVLPIYAPATDGNDPQAYATAVLTIIEQWLKEAGMVQLTSRVDLLPAGAVNNPDRPMWDGRPRSITIHETANEKIGANAEMHRRFVHNGGGPDTASFHAVVDDQESIQLLPWNAAAYHIGDGDGGEGNNTSIGIELCVNQDGAFPATVDRAARLTAALLQEFALGSDSIRQHGSWWSPSSPAVHQGCPVHLKSGQQPNGQPGPTWNDFLALVKDKLGPQPGNKSVLLQRAYAALPHWIVGDRQFEAQVDLSELQLPNDAWGLVCEKSVLWTDGGTIDAFHRGQFEDFRNRGKVTERR